jgi:hypothetical protein
MTRLALATRDRHHAVGRVCTSACAALRAELAGAGTKGGRTCLEAAAIAARCATRCRRRPSTRRYAIAAIAGRHSGAPAVACGLVPQDRLQVEGETVVYASSEHGRRHFCGRCGTALFYTNEVIFPGTIRRPDLHARRSGCDSGRRPDPGCRPDRLDGASTRTAGVRTLSGLSWLSDGCDGAIASNLNGRWLPRWLQFKNLTNGRLSEIDFLEFT